MGYLQTKRRTFRGQIKIALFRIPIGESGRFCIAVSMALFNMLAVGPQIHLLVNGIQLKGSYNFMLDILEVPDVTILDYMTTVVSTGFTMNIIGATLSIMSFWIELRPITLVALPLCSSLLTSVVLFNVLSAYSAYYLGLHIALGVADPLSHALSKYNSTENVRLIFNYIHQHYHCCGVNSFQDFLSGDHKLNKNPNAFKIFYTRIPSSCCEAAISESCIIYKKRTFREKSDAMSMLGINMIGCEPMIRKELVRLYKHLVFTELIFTNICNVLVIFLTRYFVTSVENSFRMELPELTAYGYLVPLWKPTDFMDVDS